MNARAGRLALALVAAVWLAACGGAAGKGAGTKAKPAAEAEAAAPIHSRAVVFIMAKCPHCAALFKTLLPLRRELGGAFVLTLGFVGDVDESGSPAGDGAEGAAAVLELCVGRSAGSSEAWFDFLECTYSGEAWRSLPAGWKPCAERAGIDVAAVSSCVEDGTGEEELVASLAASASAGIREAPTIFFDGHPYFGERTRDAMLVQICHGGDAPPESAPEVCRAVPPPPRVAATLLVDGACDDPEICDVEREVEFLRALVPTLDLARADFREAGGRALYDRLVRAGGPRTLPLVVVDGAIGELPIARTRFMGYLVPFGKGYLLPLGEGRDPLAEICDNGADEDGDGAVDCADDACGEALACREEEKGRLDLFVMSECPYAKELLPSVDAFLAHMGRDRRQVDLRIEFIGAAGPGGELESLHGEEEVAEDMRLACAQRLYGKGYRFMAYAVCRAGADPGADWRACVKKGMSAAEIARCADGPEGRELVAASFDRAAAAGVAASPSWLLNGKLEMEGRSAEEIRQAFCGENRAAGCEKPIPAGDEAGKLDRDAPKGCE